MTTKTPLEAVAELEAKLRAVTLKGILEAHATGLQQAASLIGDVADELHTDQTPPAEPDDTWRPKRWTTDQAHAISKVLSDLNDKIMARMKAVRVTVDGEEG